MTDAERKQAIHLAHLILGCADAKLPHPPQRLPPTITFDEAVKWQYEHWARQESLCREAYALRDDIVARATIDGKFNPEEAIRLLTLQ